MYANTEIKGWKPTDNVKTNPMSFHRLSSTSPIGWDVKPPTVFRPLPGPFTVPRTIPPRTQYFTVTLGVVLRVHSCRLYLKQMNTVTEGNHSSLSVFSFRLHLERRNNIHNIDQSTRGNPFSEIHKYWRDGSRPRIISIFLQLFVFHGVFGFNNGKY